MKKGIGWVGARLGLLISGALLAGCPVDAGPDPTAFDEAAREAAAGQGAEEPAAAASNRIVMQTPAGAREVEYVDIDGIAYVDGDIRLGPVEELEELAVDKGVGINAFERLWRRRTIPFVFDPSLSGTMKARTLQAMADWVNKAGFTFVQRTTEPEYVRFTNGNRVCSSSSVGKVPGSVTTIHLNHGRSASQLVGIATERRFQVKVAWYSDLTVSVGSATQLDAATPTQKFTLPPNRTATQIVSMDMDSTGKVFTWFNDGRFSVGSTTDLDSNAGPATFTMPAPYNASHIRGMAFAMNDRVVTYLSDGKALIGTPSELGKHGGPAAYTTAAGVTPNHILDVTLQSDGSAAAYHTNNGFSVGAVNNLGSIAALKPFATTLDCSIGSVIHEIGHAVGLAHEHSRCDRDNFVNVLLQNVQPGFEGNFNKYCGSELRDLHTYDFDSIMHYPSFAFSKLDATGAPLPTITRKHGEFINGQRTSLSVSDVRDVEEMYGYSPAKGKSPDMLLAAAISGPVGTYWYKDGTFASGASTDHDSRSGPSTFIPAPGKAISQILAIDFHVDSGSTFAWYDDLTVSEGFAPALGAWRAPRPFSLPPGYTAAHVLAIGIYGDRAYYYYNNGMRSIGSVTDADRFQGPTPFTVSSTHTLSQLVDVAIAPSNGTVFAWYDDFGLSAGTDTDLDRNFDAW